MLGLASRLHRLIQLASNPEARRLSKLGISYDEFLKYDQAWLKALDIRTIVDIGAHRGDFSWMMRQVLPAASVVAFEPLPDTCDRLSRRFSDLPNCRVVNTALGDEEGQLSFSKNEFAESSSALPLAEGHLRHFPFASRTDCIVVPCRRLDLEASRLGFDDELLIKIDVQGFEDRVIKGGWETINRARLMWVETSFIELYSGQQLFDGIYDLLRSAGLRFVGNFCQTVSDVDGTYTHADSLFLRPLS